MKTIVEITNHLEMLGFIKSNGTQCRFVSLISETEPKLKQDCPYKGVVKVSKKQGMVNVNYNTSVKRKVAEKFGVEIKDVEYENGKVWYKHLTTADGKSLPIVVNKKTPENGNFYLQFFPTKSVNVYRLPNGDMVDEAKLEPYFYSRGERSEFKPCVIAIGLENVKQLRASGVIMTTEDAEQAEEALATV